MSEMRNQCSRHFVNLDSGGNCWQCKYIEQVDTGPKPTPTVVPINQKKSLTREQTLVDKLNEVVDQYGDGMLNVSIIGALAIIQADLMADALKDD